MNILFLTPLHIGDAIISSGVLDYLLRRFAKRNPNIYVCTSRPIATLFQDESFRTYAFDFGPAPQRLYSHKCTFPFKKFWYSLVKRFAYFKFIWHMRHIRWDLIVDLSFHPPYMLRFLRRRRMVNLYTFLNSGKKWDAGFAHEAQDFAAIAGIAQLQMPKIWLHNADRGYAESIVSLAHAPILALCPTTSQKCKEWPLGYFVELIELLTRPGAPLAHYRVFISGSQRDRARCQAILDAVPSSRLMDGFGMPLGQTAAIIKHARLYIGNDSSLMHIAAALGVLTLGIFGPTREDRFGPLGPRAYTIRYDQSYDDAMERSKKEKLCETSNELMWDLSPSFVAQAVERILKEDAKVIPFRKDSNNSRIHV